jgi:protein-S-isoprenylcysteine O-methyltransferase Ste14
VRCGSRAGVKRHAAETSPLGRLANWISIAAMVVFTFVAFRWRIGVEETALRARFADQYEAYRQRTWRLIPWLY